MCEQARRLAVEGARLLDDFGRMPEPRRIMPPAAPLRPIADMAAGLRESAAKLAG